MNYSLMTLGNLIPLIAQSNQGESTITVQEKLGDLLYAAKENGIEAVDMTSLEIQYLGKEVVKEMLKIYNMRLGALIYFSSIAVPDFKGEIRNEAEQAVEMAKYFETSVLMIVPALVGVEITKTKEEMYQLIRDNLSVYVDICEHAGMIPVVEDTPDLKIPMCSMQDMDALFENIPGLYLVYDSANMFAVHENRLEYFEHFKPLIRRVHLKDVKICETAPVMAEYDMEGNAYLNVQPGMGLVEFPEIYSKLKQMNFTGTLVLEYPEFQLDREGHKKKMKEILDYFEKL